ncbi:MAG: hypothetical protein ACRD3M_00925 [Thermoanaerobaculia bacterium]
MPTSRRPRKPKAFINLPYHPSYTELFVAYIAGLSAHGMLPTIAPDIPGSGPRQLDRIVRLIAAAAYSVHDLSWRRPRDVRLNMPFELGIAVAVATRRRRRHQWVLFDSHPHRLKKVLGDIGGSKIYAHQKRPASVLYELSNAIYRNRYRRPPIEEVRAVHKRLCTYATDLRRRYRVKTLFDTRPFADLVAAAAEIARLERINARNPRHRKIY